MSSNWKKIGKNAGGEMQYNRHIRTATHNEQWEETYDASQNKSVVHALNDTTKHNVRIGIGTNHPYSRLSFGSNIGDGSRNNINKKGMIGAIAIHEKSDGKNFHGLIFNSEIKDLKYLNTAEWEAAARPSSPTASACIISATVSGSNFSTEPSGGIYINEHNLVTIGGPPEYTPCQPAVAGNLRDSDGPSLKLHIRGGMHVDGYISMIPNLTGNNNSFSLSSPYSSVPFGSIFVAQSIAGDGLALYLKTNSHPHGLEIGSTALSSLDTSSALWNGNPTSINMPISTSVDDVSSNKRNLFQNSSIIFNADYFNANWNYGDASSGLIDESAHGANSLDSKAIFSSSTSDPEGATARVRNSLVCLGGGVAICERSNFNNINLVPDESKRWTTIQCSPVSYMFNRKINTNSFFHPGTPDYDGIPPAEWEFTDIDKIRTEHNGGQLWVQKQLSIGPNMNRHIIFNEAFINIATGNARTATEADTVPLGSLDDIRNPQCSGVPGIIIGGDMQKKYKPSFSWDVEMEEWTDGMVGDPDKKLGDLGASNAIFLGCNGMVGHVFDCSNCILMGHRTKDYENERIDGAINSIIAGKYNYAYCPSGSGHNFILGTANHLHYNQNSVIIGEGNKMANPGWGRPTNDPYGDGGFDGGEGGGGGQSYESDLIGPGNYIFGYNNRIYIPELNNAVDPVTYLKNCNSITGANNVMKWSDFCTVCGSGNRVYGSFAHVMGISNEIGTRWGTSSSNWEPNSYAENVTVFGKNNKIKGNINKWAGTGDPAMGKHNPMPARAAAVKNVYIFGYKNELDGSDYESNDLSKNSFILMGSHANISVKAGSDSSNVCFALGSVEMWRDRGGGETDNGNILTVDNSGNLTITGDISLKDISANNYTGSGNLTVEGDISANNYTGSGNLTVKGDISAENIYTTNFTLTGDISAENITFRGTIYGPCGNTIIDDITFDGSSNWEVSDLGDMSWEMPDSPLIHFRTSHHVTFEYKGAGPYPDGTVNDPCGHFIFYPPPVHAWSPHLQPKVMTHYDVGIHPGGEPNHDTKLRAHVGSSNHVYVGIHHDVIDLAGADVTKNAYEYNIFPNVLGLPPYALKINTDASGQQIGVHLFITAKTSNDVYVDLAGSDLAGRIICNGNMITTILICSENRGIKLGEVAAPAAL